MHRTKSSVCGWLVRVSAALAIFAGVAGCSDRAERSVEQMIAHTSTAMQVSSTQEARRHAPAEIALAEEKLAAARQANRAGDQVEANRLVAEALVNLELARAKAETERVKAEIQRAQALLSGPAGRTPQRRAP